MRSGALQLKGIAMNEKSRRIRICSNRWALACGCCLVWLLVASNSGIANEVNDPSGAGVEWKAPTSSVLTQLAMLMEEEAEAVRLAASAEARGNAPEKNVQKAPRRLPEAKTSASSAPPSDRRPPASAEKKARKTAPPTAGDSGTAEEGPADDSPSHSAGRPGLQNLLTGVDPSLFNLSGAELEVEVVGDTVLIQGSDEDVAMLELLITMVDQSVKQKELRVVQVSQRDANEIARSAEEAIRKALEYPNMRPEDEVSVTALSSNILLVAALPRDIEFVINVIESVDAVPPAIGDFEQMSFPIKYRRASEVAEQLGEIITKIQERQGARGAEGEIQIIPNDANNSLLVIAPETEREKLQKLIGEIDVEPVKGWGEVKLTLFPVVHSKADGLANTINELLATEERRTDSEEVIRRLIINKVDIKGETTELPPIDLEKPMKIIPHDETNSLIVATVDENVGPMGELIRLMDGVPVAEEIIVRLFPLQFADAGSIKDLLDDMFSDGKDLPKEADGDDFGAVPEGPLGEALVYNVGIAADQRSNTLVVSGRSEQMLLVKTIVDELDKPAVALKFPLRLMPLEFADASRIGQIVEDLIEKRIEALEATDADGSAIEREKVFLSVDMRTNSLIVSASEENFAEIAKIIKQLDIEPATIFSSIRIVPCTCLSAKDMKEKIDELWERKSSLRGEFELTDDSPVLVADERSNSLLIASSPEDYQEIKGIIETLESQPLIEDTRLFSLQHADAKALAWKLDELFSGLAGLSEALEAPTIIPDDRSNSLIVAATRDAMERLEDLVARLDVETGANKTASFVVYDVKHGAAARLAPKMQELFDDRSEGQDTEKTPIVIMAEELSNTIICSASADDHEMIIELLALLDKPSSLARQFAIFPVHKASATKVTEQLDGLFQSQTQGEGPDRTDAIAMEADERTNSIIVWGSATELENVAEVIKQLDTSSPAKERVVKVIQLKQALAEDFAGVLEEALIGDSPGDENEQAVFVSWQEKRDDGTVIMRRMLRQDIKVVPDSRTNSLMVWAPAESLEMLEALIYDFDRMRPVQSEIRLFPLINSDAKAMQERLAELFEADGAGGGDDVLRQLAISGDFGDMDWRGVGQELRFVAEDRTNTLIAAGSEIDLRMVEELVHWLDSQDVEERITTVVPVKFRDAADIASAIQSFNQQEEDIYGSVDDETSQVRLAERQISVESLDSDEGGSSSLIVGASRRHYARTMEMIDQLDRPEPQVAIQVLIAEVILSDDFELGIEIAGQDLNFSENAVLGPNGIIQGSDFDVVAGTDIGAIASGQGFNFTVTGEDFGFLMHALQRDSRVEVLQRPLLMVRNGGEGEINISDSIPFVTSTTITDSGGIQSQVGREDVGIILTTTPHISPDGYVTLEISQEISNFSGDQIQLTEGLTQPVISERKVETNITVRDGETVVVGGLITTRESEGESKVPLLGDIPGLGVLFRSTSVSKSRAELLVVLTVDILDTDRKVEEMAQKQLTQYDLSETIRRSPLMESLRIRPDETSMGPVGSTPDKPDGEDGRQPPRTSEPDRYGPKPKVYGPIISRPRSVTTGTGAIYGPEVANGSVAEQS